MHESPSARASTAVSQVQRLRNQIASFAIIAVAFMLASTGAFGQQAAGNAAKNAETIMQDWPAASKKAAQNMMKKYGEPDEMTKSLLIWRDNGPWVRTIVYGYEVDHNWPMPHKDVLEQTIPYDVPEDKFDDLARFDGSVIAERTKGELSARCDSEAANILALNLANDVIKGTKTVDQARSSYVEAMKQVMAGSPPDVAQRLLFEVATANINNPGEAVISR